MRWGLGGWHLSKKFIFVSSELSSEKDYVIAHSVHSMYIVCT